MNKLKYKNGITLVALIITIIVLLILAMVSISLIINSGIITKSKTSVDKYSEEEIGEQLKLAYSEYQMSQYTGTPIDIQAKLREIYGNDTTASLANGKLTATIKGKTYEYNTSTGETTEKLDLSTIIANAQRHPQQNEEITDIGIDMYGNAVNLNYWDYQFDENLKTFTIGIYNPGPGYTKGYKGDFVDGKIVGEIPQYIKKGNEQYILTALEGAFAGCTSLITPPSIPNSVTNMGGCFQGCSSLTTAPLIPNSVSNLYHTFFGCSALTGNLILNLDNVSSYNECLYAAVTNDGCSLVVSGTCPQLDDIIATAVISWTPKTLNNNVTKGQ